MCMVYVVCVCANACVRICMCARVCVRACVCACACACTYVRLCAPVYGAYTCVCAFCLSGRGSNRFETLSACDDGVPRSTLISDGGRPPRQIVTVSSFRAESRVALLGQDLQSTYVGY